MQMTISGHHLEITDPIRDYVTQKLSKLERHYEKITSISVILTVEKLVQKAEATVHVSGGDLFAIAEHD
ncbi:MAG: ribosome-associated translation inhibitor RaiA, partial [Porticoccaceae bacterium]|nr:ribosome-associated translation inhibitor RaiA [Porticoccaceae bacterium]